MYTFQFPVFLIFYVLLTLCLRLSFVSHSFPEYRDFSLLIFVFSIHTQNLLLLTLTDCGLGISQPLLIKRPPRDVYSDFVILTCFCLTPFWFISFWLPRCGCWQKRPVWAQTHQLTRHTGHILGLNKDILLSFCRFLFFLRPLTISNA